MSAESVKRTFAVRALRFGNGPVRQRSSYCIECVETRVSNAVENCFAETTLFKELFFTRPNTQR
jgi:hypothetical protein